MYCYLLKNFSDIINEVTIRQCKNRIMQDSAPSHRASDTTQTTNTTRRVPSCGNSHCRNK